MGWQRVSSGCSSKSFATEYTKKIEGAENWLRNMAIHCVRGAYVVKLNMAHLDFDRV